MNWKPTSTGSSPSPIGDHSFGAWKERLLWGGLVAVGYLGVWMVRNQLDLKDKLNEIGTTQAVFADRMVNQAALVQELKSQNEGLLRAQAIMQSQLDRLNSRLKMN